MGNVREKWAEAKGAIKRAGAALKGERGIFARLAQEHGEISSLKNQISSSADDFDVRRRLFPRVKQELLAHAQAEEQVFYPMAVRFEQTRDLAMHGIGEHQEIEIVLRRLSGMDMTAPEWIGIFRQLKRRVEEHVEDEEDELFPKLKQLVSSDEVERAEWHFIAEEEGRLRM